MLTAEQLEERRRGVFIRPAIDPVERFMRFVSPEPNTGCWLWTGAIGTCGYGQFLMGGKTRTASRAAYLMFVGQIGAGLCVCHRCDERSCVSPAHLFLGSELDNVRDRVRKGRSARNTGDSNGARIHRDRMPRGENHFHSKVSDLEVEMALSEIAAGRSMMSIARGLGLHRCTVERWVRGEGRGRHADT